MIVKASTGERIGVSRERLDRGGYTSQGRYFGTGKPLYRFDKEENGATAYVRCNDLASARTLAKLGWDKIVHYATVGGWS